MKRCDFQVHTHKHLDRVLRRDDLEHWPRPPGWEDVAPTRSGVLRQQAVVGQVAPMCREGETGVTDETLFLLLLKLKHVRVAELGVNEASALLPAFHILDAKACKIKKLFHHIITYEYTYIRIYVTYSWIPIKITYLFYLYDTYAILTTHLALTEGKRSRRLSLSLPLSLPPSPPPAAK